MQNTINRSEEIGGRAAGRILGVHHDTVNRWARAGLITPVRVLPSGYRRYRLADVIALSDRMAADAAR